MKYLESFKLASEDEEREYIVLRSRKADMQCYSSNTYPFKLFPFKGLEHLNFEPITIIYGGNGSGKSTILNLIAEKLRLERTAPFNNTPYIEDYLQYCDFKLSYGQIEITENADNTLVIKNLTGKDLPSVRLFYKYFMEEEQLLVGGVTFTANITDLKAGQSVTIKPAHYLTGASAVVMVQTYEVAS